MIAFWSILLAVSASPAFVAEQDGVRIRVDVASNLYTWTVENLSAEPITSFAIDVINCHAYQGPAGWTLDGPVPTGTFRAWCTQPEHALKPGQTGQFAARFMSRGASLGVGPVAIGLVNSTVVEFPTVWRPVREPIDSIVVVPIVVGLLALLHTFVGRRRINDA